MLVHNFLETLLAENKSKQVLVKPIDRCGLRYIFLFSLCLSAEMRMSWVLPPGMYGGDTACSACRYLDNKTRDPKTPYVLALTFPPLTRGARAFES